MSKFDEFKARCRIRHLSAEEEEELRLFFDSVQDASDDYEHWIDRLRSSGKFKSIFAKGFGANARQTNMTTDTVLSDKERREYPRDLYKTILGMAQDRKKPSGLSAAISDFLGEKNPHLQIPNETTLLVPLEALVSRKAQSVTTATAGGFLIENDIAAQIRVHVTCGFRLRSRGRACAARLAR